jgi:hypothetical protein
MRRPERTLKRLQRFRLETGSPSKRLSGLRQNHQRSIQMPRHRAFIPLITLLALATAVALFGAGWVIAEPAVADPDTAETESTVRAFYAAANQTIHTGDSS